MKRIFLLEENDIAVMQRGQAIALEIPSPIGINEILLTMERRTYPPTLQREHIPTEMTQDKLLTITDVAQRLGLSKRAVQKRLQTGRLQGSRLGMEWRIPESALSATPRRHQRSLPATLPARMNFLTRSLASPSKQEISVEKAAQRLRCNRTHVLAKLRRGELPGRKLMIGHRERWFLPNNVSWGKEGTDFKRSKAGHRIMLGQYPCKVCRKVWPTKGALTTHIGRAHTHTIKTPGER